MSKRPKLCVAAQDLMHVSVSNCGKDVDEEDLFGSIDDELMPGLGHDGGDVPLPCLGQSPCLPGLGHDGYVAAAEEEKAVE